MKNVVFRIEKDPVSASVRQEPDLGKIVKVAWGYQ